MDGGRFDQLARGLGDRRSRRSAVKLLGAAALGAVGVAGFRREADAARPPKVGVCHITGNANKPWVYITVSQSAASVLEQRGDTVNPDFSSDVDHCGTCGHSCWDEWYPYNAYPVCDWGTCTWACYDGYHDDGYGNCVVDSPCQPYSFEDPICFWMETSSGNYCWVPASGNPDFNLCQQYDSCAVGGGNYGYEGGCYKWSTSSDTSIWPDANGWPD